MNLQANAQGVYLTSLTGGKVLFNILWPSVDQLKNVHHLDFADASTTAHELLKDVLNTFPSDLKTDDFTPLLVAIKESAASEEDMTAMRVWADDMLERQKGALFDILTESTRLPEEIRCGPWTLYRKASRNDYWTIAAYILAALARSQSTAAHEVATMLIRVEVYCQMIDNGETRNTVPDAVLSWTQQEYSRGISYALSGLDEDVVETVSDAEDSYVLVNKLVSS